MHSGYYPPSFGPMTSCITEIFNEIIWEKSWEHNPTNVEPMRLLCNNFLSYLRTIWKIIPADTKGFFRLRAQLQHLLNDEYTPDFLNVEVLQKIIDDITHKGAKLKLEITDPEEQENFINDLETYAAENFPALSLFSPCAALTKHFNQRYYPYKILNTNDAYQLNLITKDALDKDQWEEAAQAIRKFIDVYQFDPLTVSQQDKKNYLAWQKELAKALAKIAFEYNEQNNKAGYHNAYHFAKYAIKEAEIYCNLATDPDFLTLLNLQALTVINSYANSVTPNNPHESLIYYRFIALSMNSLTTKDPELSQQIEARKKQYSENLIISLFNHACLHTHPARKHLLLLKKVIELIQSVEIQSKDLNKILIMAHEYSATAAANLSDFYSSDYHNEDLEDSSGFFYSACELATTAINLSPELSNSPFLRKAFETLYSALMNTAKKLLKSIDHIDLLKTLRDYFMLIKNDSAADTKIELFFIRAIARCHHQIALEIPEGPGCLKEISNHYFEAINELKLIPNKSETSLDILNLAYCRQNYAIAILQNAEQDLRILHEGLENTIEEIKFAITVNAKAINYFPADPVLAATELEKFSNCQTSLAYLLNNCATTYYNTTDDLSYFMVLLSLALQEINKIPQDEMTATRKESFDIIRYTFILACHKYYSYLGKVSEELIIHLPLAYQQYLKITTINTDGELSNFFSVNLEKAYSLKLIQLKTLLLKCQSTYYDGLNSFFSASSLKLPFNVETSIPSDCSLHALLRIRDLMSPKNTTATAEEIINLLDTTISIKQLIDSSVIPVEETLHSLKI